MSKPLSLALLLSLSRRYAGELTWDSVLAYEMACGATDTLVSGIVPPLDADMRGALSTLFSVLVPPRLMLAEPRFDEKGAETSAWVVRKDNVTYWVDEKGLLVASGPSGSFGLELLRSSSILWVRSFMCKMLRRGEDPNVRSFWYAVDRAAVRYHVASPAPAESLPAALRPIGALLEPGNVFYCARHGLVFGRLFTTEPGGMRDHRVTLQVLSATDGSVSGFVVFYVSDAGLLPGGGSLAGLGAWLCEKHPHCKEGR